MSKKLTKDQIKAFWNTFFDFKCPECGSDSLGLWDREKVIWNCQYCDHYFQTSKRHLEELEKKLGRKISEWKGIRMTR